MDNITIDGNLRGIFAASLTPLKNDLSIDLPAMIKHCKWLLDNGCDGILIFGTTGEGISFSLTEKKETILYLVEQGIPSHKLIVGTGLCAYTETVSLSQFSLDNGIKKLLMLPPYFYKNVTDDGLFNYFDRVIKELGIRECKIYLYHLPTISPIGFSFELIERLITKYPEVVVGMKDSGGDWTHMQQIMTRFPSFNLLPGTETYLLNILKAGGLGCISASVNITVALAAEVYKNWQNKDMTNQMNEIINIRKTVAVFPMIPALKSIMSRKTGKANWQNVRPPLVKMVKEDSQKLYNDLSRFKLTL